MKQTMKAGILVVLGLALAAPAYARIGENEEQIKARYGKPVRTNTKIFAPRVGRVYHAADMDITVIFVDGVSGVESFSKKNKFDWLSMNEVELLLKANSLGQEWRVEKRPDATTHEWEWALVDTNGTALGVARFDPIKGDLMVCSQKFIDAGMAKQKAEESAKLKDF